MATPLLQPILANGQSLQNPAEASRAAIVTAYHLACDLMTQYGLMFVGQNRWDFKFNRNLRRAGVCKYPTPTRPGVIELSLHFIVRNSEAEVRDTILHEIAHALVGPKHGHDAVWKAKCLEIGARPERCFGEEIDMPKGRYRATCPGCKVEFQRHRRPKHVTGTYCRRCGKEAGMLTWYVWK